MSRKHVCELFRVAVSTSHGFGIFDLVRSKTVYATAISVPSGKFNVFGFT